MNILKASLVEFLVVDVESLSQVVVPIVVALHCSALFLFFIWFFLRVFHVNVIVYRIVDVPLLGVEGRILGLSILPHVLF